MFIIWRYQNVHLLYTLYSFPFELSITSYNWKICFICCETRLLEAAGNLQLCAGQPGGCEAAVHVVSDIL